MRDVRKRIRSNRPRAYEQRSAEIHDMKTTIHGVKVYNLYGRLTGHRSLKRSKSQQRFKCVLFLLLLYFFFKAALSSLGQFDTKPKQTQQLAPPNGGFLGEHTKEVSGGVFEKRQIRFKLTAIVIQVEVSLHILATIASRSLQSNSYFVLGDIRSIGRCAMYTTANPAVKQGKTNDTSYIIICSPPKSSEVNGVVFVLPPSIRLLILTGVCLSSCPTMGQSGLLGGI